MDLTLSQVCLIVNMVLFMLNGGSTSQPNSELSLVEAENLLKQHHPDKIIEWDTEGIDGEVINNQSRLKCFVYRLVERQKRT